MPHSQLPDWLSHMLAAIMGGGGWKLLDWFNTRRKMIMDGDSALQETIDRRVKLILEDDEKTITRLTQEIESARKSIGEMEQYVEELVGALRRAGIEIPKRPDSIKPH